MTLRRVSIQPVPSLLMRRITLLNCINDWHFRLRIKSKRADSRSLISRVNLVNATVIRRDFKRRH